jgi:hypothetical protein
MVTATPLPDYRNKVKREDTRTQLSHIVYRVSGGKEMRCLRKAQVTDEYVSANAYIKS